MKLTDELVIVVPPIKTETSAAVKEGILDIWREIHAVMKDTCTALTATEQQEQLKQFMNKHEVRRDGTVAHEFPVRIRNYAERDHFQYEDEERNVSDADISSMWPDIGLNVELCGFSTAKTALLRLRFIAYVEVYKTVEKDKVLNSGLAFATLNLN